MISFWDRPYRTINDDLVNKLGDWPTGLPLVGSIEQSVDSADILARPPNRPAVIAAYRVLAQQLGQVTLDHRQHLVDRDRRGPAPRSAR